MKTTPRITLNNVTFHLPNSPVQLNDINLSFEKLKYGVIGLNGVGKTTFLQLLSGSLVPNSGSIQRIGTVIALPQSYSSFSERNRVCDILEVTPILSALHHINIGSADEKYFDIVSDNWDIEMRITEALTFFKLWPLDMAMPFNQLSGGQKTKLFLAKTLIFPTDFILLDEPTNNLDIQSRGILYKYIEESSKGMVIVSHDRALLNKCDRIIEITTQGIEVYGGNYDFYKELKEIKKQAVLGEIHARVEILNKAKKTIQSRFERHEQNEASGRKGKAAQIKAKGCYDKMGVKAQKARSEKTNKRIRTQATRKLETINDQLKEACTKLEIQEKLNVCLAFTTVPNNKIVVKIENLNFSYDETPLINDFNLQITGPERVAITGPNGCGKSTLIRLIRGELAAKSGKIFIGIDNMAYLDQSISVLDTSLSIVENFLALNPDSKPFDAYSALAAFKFRNKDADKIVGQLSGGEKMRAGLAVSLMSKHPPQLIILDEPTNHLDLEAVLAIEGALKQYQGAIIAVSHDKAFLDGIDIKRIVTLE